VYLSEKEYEAYCQLEKEYVLPMQNEDISAANAAVLCGKLVQLASGCIYSDDGKIIKLHDRKLDALEDLIEAQNGKPVLVAYWYKHERERIMERFKCREIKTDVDIAEWNAGKIPVALIQPSSAGHGLNLQSGGNTLIWYTMPWSLELYQQTNARLWRQGQCSESVVIQHFVAVGTIDEEIMKALSGKDEIQSNMMNAVKARIK
jgi:hypothetical protein